MTTIRLPLYAKIFCSLLAASAVSTPSSSKRYLQIGMLTAVTIGAICTNATNATAATLTYFTNLSLFNAVSSTSVIEDFEAFTPKGTSLHSFTSNGNTYTALEGSYTQAHGLDVNVTPPGYTNFGVPITTSSVLTSDGNEDFRVDFGTPKAALGFDTYSNTYGPPTIQIFGSGGLLGTYSVVQDSTKVGFFGVVASEPITSIRWTGVNGGVINTGIDNIRTGVATATPTTSVPEPFTIIGTLVGGTAAFRMRKKLKAIGS